MESRKSGRGLWPYAVKSTFFVDRNVPRRDLDGSSSTYYIFSYTPIDYSSGSRRFLYIVAATNVAEQIQKRSANANVAELETEIN